MSRSRYRVGVIGATGRGDYGHAVDTAFLKIDDVELVAVADADEAGREKAKARLGVTKAYGDYRKMLQDEKLDIVAICPRWIDQHFDMLLACAEAGCHVYLEKPFCRTLEECDTINHQFEMRHLKLGIAHIAVYSPVFQTVKKLIADGIIGDLLEVRGRGKEDRRGGGEDLWVLGSHIFAVMHKLCGPASRCFATVGEGGKPVERKNVKQGAEGIGLLAGDHIEASYALPNSVTGYFASRKEMAGNPSRFAVQIFGSKGLIELETSYLAQAQLLRDPSWSPGRSNGKWETISSAGVGIPEPRTDGTYEGGHIAAIRDLIDAIDKHRDTKCSTRDCTSIIEMIAAIFESHRVGKPVDMPLVTRANPLSLLG
jgi:predicted dehydrogenase